MNIFKYYIIVLQILITVNSIAQINNNSPIDSYSNNSSNLDTTYFVKYNFSSWKDYIFARNDSIFSFYYESIGYRNNDTCNANEIFNFNVDIYQLDKSDNIKIIGHDGPNCHPIDYNLNDNGFGVDKLDSLQVDEEIKEYLPKNVKVVSLLNDTTLTDVPRIVISWVDYKKDKEWGWLYDTSCGLAIFEFYEDWEVKYIQEIQDFIWVETKIYDMNQTGFKEIIYKSVSLGGSGFTYSLELIQRK